MNKEEKAVFRIWQASDVTTEIQCSKCAKSDTVHCADDAMEISQSWYEDGWRATEKHVYCPKCAKKFKIK